MTMMPWYKTVTNKGALTVFPDASFTGGHWGPVLDPALKEFNDKISKVLKLTLSKTDNKVNAHIVLVTEKGTGIHGNADLTPIRIGGVNYLDKVTIRVPATPMAERSREAGPGVRLYILVHELIHCVGLTNDEHSNDDVFTKDAQLIAKNGWVNNTQVKDDSVLASDGKSVMPPIRIGATTLANLQKVWPAVDSN